jgi:hypothetical protein
MKVWTVDRPGPIDTRPLRRSDRAVPTPGPGLAMIIIGFLYDFWLIPIGLFVLMGARAEEQAARQRPDKERATNQADVIS